MQTIYQPSLVEILPTSITNDPKLKALAEALDVELVRLSAATREVLHLPRLEELDGKILDFLSEQFHIDFFEPLYLTDAEKKNLIRTSIAWHRIKGTPAAVEQIANAAFREAEVIEWFDYGGAPYHFQIKTRGFKETPDGFKTFLRMLYMAKNVRSWCDKIIIDYPAKDLHLYCGVVPVETGLKVVQAADPPSKHIDLFAGMAVVETGIKSGQCVEQPADRELTVYLGNTVVRSGNITFLSDNDDLRPRRHFIENAIADIAIADIAIARPNEIPKLPEPVDPEIYAIADGEWLRVYFDFATGRDKPLLIKNPRSDLTVGDINDVGLFAALKNIFNNQHAENTLGIKRADLIRGFTINDNDDAALLPDSGKLRLFFDFPSGNNRKILLHNPRHSITIGDIKALGKQAAAEKLLLNARAQTTSGIKHAAIIKNFKVTAGNDPVTF